MRKLLSLFLALAMMFGIACVHAEANVPDLTGDYDDARGEAPGGGLVGGWTPAADPSVTEETKALVEKALEGLLGMNYVPVAYLGSQVVAGVNHAILCQGTAVVPDAVPEWKILFLYEDLEGNVSVLSIADFDFGALCEY